MPKRLPVHGLDPSTGTPGQVPTIGPLGNVVEYADPATGSDLGLFNVKQYGATGIAGDDPLGPVNDAIAALNATDGGVLYFPPGVYEPSAGFDTIEVPTTVSGAGCADSHFRGAPTTIRLASTTGTLFTVGTAAHGSKFSDLDLVNTAGSTPTAGSAIHVLGGDGAAYDRLTISGFYTNMDMEDGQEWTMQRCFLYSPVKYAMRIRHVDLPDGGDMGITNCQFLAGDYNCDALVRYESGGGLRLTNCKFNTRTLSHFAQCGLDASIGSITTVDLLVSTCSFENINGPAIRGRVAAFGEFSGVVIVGNQFGYYSTTSYSAIDIASMIDVTIGANIGLARFSGSSAAFVKLDTVTHATVALNTIEGFAGGEYTLISCTDVKAGVVPTSRSIGVGTGLTGGGDLSADRTIAIDTTSEAERVRDVIGAALVAGSGITIVVDDAGDTVTIAASATTSGIVPITALDSGGNLTFLTVEDGSLITAEVLS